jgi:hypothetical protein
MKNAELAELNFRKLINYGVQPSVKVKYDPLQCYGYCIDCEQKYLVEPGQLDLISHACDSSDFEAILGPLPSAQPIDIPIVFLLEDPGGDYGNGERFSYEGCRKQPPTNHYYWSPQVHTWPASIEELRHFYGPYFAYLMRNHGLRNVYITNLVKCNLSPAHKNSRAGGNAGPFASSAGWRLCQNRGRRYAARPRQESEFDA